MDDRITAYLAQHAQQTFRARDLRRVAGANATKDVNKLLYNTLLPQKRVLQVHEDGVTKWRAPLDLPPPAIPVRTDPDHERTLVAVDLGNVHDCFLPARTQAAGDPAVSVLAYADYAYNGPESAVDDGSVWQAPRPGRNLADMALLFAVQRVLLGPTPPTTVVIASKDNLMQDAIEVLRDAHPRVAFQMARSWNDLKYYL